jgi:hypothetical protein
MKYHWTHQIQRCTNADLSSFALKGVLGGKCTEIKSFSNSNNARYEVRIVVLLNIQVFWGWCRYCDVLKRWLGDLDSGLAEDKQSRVENP